MSTKPEPITTRTFRFACRVVKLYVEIQRTNRVPEHIARQLLAAGTSVGANVEESRAALSRRDLTAKLSIALKEARETSYWLRLLTATGLLEERRLGDLNQEAGALVAILTASQRSLRNQAVNGVARPQAPASSE